MVCDHRYGKDSLYALTRSIVFEYDLKTCVVKDRFPSELKTRTVNTTIGCVKRWPEVDPLRYADHIDKKKEHMESCCNITREHGVSDSALPVSPGPRAARASHQPLESCQPAALRTLGQASTLGVVPARRPKDTGSTINPWSRASPPP